jgi:hypothetical protein
MSMHHILSGNILKLMIKMFPDPKDFKDFTENFAEYFILLESGEMELELFEKEITNSAEKFGADSESIKALISDIEKAYKEG